MLDTAAGADQLGRSVAGSGEMRRWRALYAKADVEEELEFERVVVRKVMKEEVHCRCRLSGLNGTTKRARRAAIV
jgi:hypothetical protein